MSLADICESALEEAALRNHGRSLHHIWSESPAARRIRSSYVRLTRAQRRLADYVLANPFVAATRSIDELAEANATSIASVSRFVRSAEFSGFAQFRAELVAALRHGFKPEQPAHAEHEGDATTEIAASLRQQAGQLRALPARLDMRALAHAAHAIAHASSIAIAAAGMCVPLARLMAFRLAAAGRPQPRVLDGCHVHAGPAPAAGALLIVLHFLPDGRLSRAQQASLAAHRGRIVLLTDDPALTLAEDAMRLVLDAGDGRAEHGPLAVFSLVSGICNAVAGRRRPGGNSIGRGPDRPLEQQQTLLPAP